MREAKLTSSNERVATTLVEVGTYLDARITRYAFRLDVIFSLASRRLTRKLPGNSTNVPLDASVPTYSRVSRILTPRHFTMLPNSGGQDYI